VCSQAWFRFLPETLSFFFFFDDDAGD